MKQLIDTVLNFARIINRYRRPEYSFQGGHEQWRNWIKESYSPEPAPQTNPVYTMYQLLPPKIKALCQKPIPIIQNREPTIDQPIDEPDLENYKFSNEVPANLSFEAQGSDFTNEWLDAGQEGRYLREHCIQRNGANHFLHLKTLVDLRSQPEHHNPEKLSKLLNIPYNLAFRLAGAFKALDFDRKMYLKIMKGPNGLELKSMVEIITFIEGITKTAEQLQEVTIEWDENHLSCNPDAIYIDQYNQYINPEVSLEDQEDLAGDNNPYSTNRLHNGNDSLSWEFQRLIETADDAQLDRLRDGMKPSKRTSEEAWKLTKFFMANYNTVPADYSSRTRWDVKKQKTVPATSTGLLWQKPKFHYFTDGMKSHFWTLYHARRDELRNQVRPVAQLSPDAKIALEWVKSLGKGSQTCSIIHAASDGKSYSLYGMDIVFTAKLHQHEVNTLWQAYRTL